MSTLCNFSVNVLIVIFIVTMFTDVTCHTVYTFSNLYFSDNGVDKLLYPHVFRGLNLDGQCEPIQMEIDTLETCADEVQVTVNQQKADMKRLKKDLAKLKEDESSISADVDELTQALHDDVTFHDYVYCLAVFHCSLSW